MHYRCDLLVVGGGMAAARLLKQLEKSGYQGEVALASRESAAGYNRVLLPGYLGGHCNEAELMSDSMWMSSSLFTIKTSAEVCHIDLVKRLAITRQNDSFAFSKLVFAIGSTVAKPIISGRAFDQIMELRCLDDAKKLRSAAAEARRVVVVGGGLLGLEAADALCNLGLELRLVHRGKQLMNRHLDDAGGICLAKAFKDKGIAVELGVGLERIAGTDRISSVKLDNGDEYAADLVLFATGARANTTLASAAGVICKDGICTDAYLRTNVPDVYALGECAQVDGVRHSLVSAVHAQADALASTLAGVPSKISAPILGTRLKVSGINVFSAGNIRPLESANSSDLVVSDPVRGIYRRLLFAGGHLIGAVLLGETRAAMEIARRINTRVDEREREQLVFGYV